MTHQIGITPAGHLVLEFDGTDDHTASELDPKLIGAFEESAPHGLLYLASIRTDRPLPQTLGFWRQYAHQLFQAICLLDENSSNNWTKVAPPSDDELKRLVESAPPTKGLEYLSEDLLRRLWNDLRDFAWREAQAYSQGVSKWLEHVNPVWHQLGRVTFHLAENKRDPDRPFAFLATYAHRLSERAKVQHLPLGQALKEYAGAGNRDKLTVLLEPVSRAASESTLVRELLDSRALFQPQAWTIRRAHQFLQEVPRIEQSGVVVRVPNWWNPRRPPRPQVQLRIGQRPLSRVGVDSLLDFNTEISLDDEPLTEKEKREILKSTDGLILLRGKWVEVDRDRLRQALDHWGRLEAAHAGGIDFIQGMRLLSGATLEGAALEADIANGWSRVVTGDWLRETLQKLRDPSNVTGLVPGKDLHANLRPYQVDGVRWLWFMVRLGLGACLADDMGLGKTIQMIDLFLQLKREKLARPRPHLLIVPASLVGNWKQELERFGPSLQVFYAHRAESSADELAAIERDPSGRLSAFDLVITTYGMARSQEWLAKVPWRLVVLDEAQAIKNAGSAQSRSVKRLESTGRIVLTGTPLENHLGDVWSLFDFCSPGLLGTATQFKQYVKRLNKGENAQAFGALRALVRPYILRRLKTDPNIVPDLPDKTEMRVECGLSKKQTVLYERAIKQLEQQLENAEGIERRGIVLSTLMQLKQICNHPSQYLGESPFDVKDSGKFQRLAQVCESVVERQEKMLVFTQFQSLTEPLAAHLTTVFGRQGLILHGGTPVKKRSELVREFQTDRGPPFFVISLKAGGSGLNLTAASHVIHFDRWWNPAVENQATDRAFRIGQKRNVLVHKFVCRGTVEERIDQMISDKQKLADQLLSQGGEVALTEMSDEELLGFVALDINRATSEE